MTMNPCWGSSDKLKQMHFPNALFILCILNKDASVSPQYPPPFFAVYQITLFPINNLPLWHYKMGQGAAFSLLLLLSYPVREESKGRKILLPGSHRLKNWGGVSARLVPHLASIHPEGSRRLHFDAVTPNVKEPRTLFTQQSKRTQKGPSQITV